MTASDDLTPIQKLEALIKFGIVRDYRVSGDSDSRQTRYVCFCHGVSFGSSNPDPETSVLRVLVNVETILAQMANHSISLLVAWAYIGHLVPIKYVEKVDPNGASFKKYSLTFSYQGITFEVRVVSKSVALDTRTDHRLGCYTLAYNLMCMVAVLKNKGITKVSIKEPGYQGFRKLQDYSEIGARVILVGETTKTAFTSHVATEPDTLKFLESELSRYSYVGAQALTDKFKQLEICQDLGLISDQTHWPSGSGVTVGYVGWMGTRCEFKLDHIGGECLNALEQRIKVSTFENLMSRLSTDMRQIVEELLTLIQEEKLTNIRIEKIKTGVKFGFTYRGIEFLVTSNTEHSYRSRYMVCYRAVLKIAAAVLSPPPIEGRVVKVVLEEIENYVPNKSCTIKTNVVVHREGAITPISDQIPEPVDHSSTVDRIMTLIASLEAPLEASSSDPAPSPAHKELSGAQWIRCLQNLGVITNYRLVTNSKISIEYSVFGSGLRTFVTNFAPEKETHEQSIDRTLNEASKAILSGIPIVVMEAITGLIQVASIDKISETKFYEDYRRRVTFKYDEIDFEILLNVQDRSYQVAQYQLMANLIRDAIEPLKKTTITKVKLSEISPSLTKIELSRNSEDKSLRQDLLIRIHDPLTMSTLINFIGEAQPKKIKLPFDVSSYNSDAIHFCLTNLGIITDYTREAFPEHVQSSYSVLGTPNKSMTKRGPKESLQYMVGRDLTATCKTVLRDMIPAEMLELVARLRETNIDIPVMKFSGVYGQILQFSCKQIEFYLYTHKIHMSRIEFYKILVDLFEKVMGPLQKLAGETKMEIKLIEDTLIHTPIQTSFQITCGELVASKTVIGSLRGESTINSLVEFIESLKPKKPEPSAEDIKLFDRLIDLGIMSAPIIEKSAKYEFRADYQYYGRGARETGDTEEQVSKRIQKSVMGQLGKDTRKSLVKILELAGDGEVPIIKLIRGEGKETMTMTYKGIEFEIRTIVTSKRTRYVPASYKAAANLVSQISRLCEAKIEKVHLFEFVDENSNLGTIIRLRSGALTIEPKSKGTVESQETIDALNKALCPVLSSKIQFSKKIEILTKLGIISNFKLDTDAGYSATYVHLGNLEMLETKAATEGEAHVRILARIFALPVQPMRGIVERLVELALEGKFEPDNFKDLNFNFRIDGVIFELHMMSGSGMRPYRYHCYQTAIRLIEEDVVSALKGKGLNRAPKVILKEFIDTSTDRIFTKIEIYCLTMLNRCSASTEIISHDETISRLLSLISGSGVKVGLKLPTGPVGVPGPVNTSSLSQQGPGNPGHRGPEGMRGVEGPVSTEAMPGIKMLGAPASSSGVLIKSVLIKLPASSKPACPGVYFLVDKNLAEGIYQIQKPLTSATIPVLNPIGLWTLEGQAVMSDLVVGLFLGNPHPCPWVGVAQQFRSVPKEGKEFIFVSKNDQSSNPAVAVYMGVLAGKSMN